MKPFLRSPNLPSLPSAPLVPPAHQYFPRRSVQQRRALTATFAVTLTAVLTALALVLSLAGCVSTGVRRGGPNAGGAQTQAAPTSTDTCGGYSWCVVKANPDSVPSAAASTDCGGYSWCSAAPNPTHDAQPPGDGIPVDPPYEDGYTDPGKDCVVNFSPTVSKGISFTDHSHYRVQAKVTLICAVPPQILTMTVRLEFKNAAGNWIDEAPIAVLNHPAPTQILPMVPKHFNPVAECYSGLWRIEVYWQGLKRDGTPFPDAGDPADLSSAPEEVSC